MTTQAPDYQPRPFRVLMEERYHDLGGYRFWFSVPAAIGPNDAKNQARHANPEYVALKAEEVGE